MSDLLRHSLDYRPGHPSHHQLPRRQSNTQPIPSVLRTKSTPVNDATTLAHRYIQKTFGEVDRSKIRYELGMRQEPKRARISGSGPQVDRRLVDPPPIVSLRLILNEAENVINSGGMMKSRLEQNLLHSANFFCRAALCMTDDDDELRLMEDTRTPYLTGSLVSSIYHLRDPVDHSYASFFVFNDLNCHYEGQFRFRFFLYEWLEDGVQLCGEIFSKVFTVYSAKRFPGLDVSTDISRSFQEQGMRIRVRRPTFMRRKQQSHEEDHEDQPQRSRSRAETSSGSEDVPPPPPSKRPKVSKPAEAIFVPSLEPPRPTNRRPSLEVPSSNVRGPPLEIPSIRERSSESGIRGPELAPLKNTTAMMEGGKGEAGFMRGRTGSLAAILNSPTVNPKANWAQEPTTSTPS